MKSPGRRAGAQVPVKRMAALIAALVLLGFALFRPGTSSHRRTIGRLVSQWGPALNRGDTRTVSQQFHLYHASGIDSMGNEFCCGRSTVDAFLQKDLAMFFQGKRHRFRLGRLRLFENEQVAVAEVFHEIDDAGAKTSIAGVLADWEGNWQWMAAWPFLPVVAPPLAGSAAEPAHLLDGTEWDVAGTRTEAQDILIFERRAVASIRGIKPPADPESEWEDAFYPAPYSARSEGDRIVWSSTQTSLLGHRAVWTGEISGDRMKGRYVEDDPADEFFPKRELVWNGVRR